MIYGLTNVNVTFGPRRELRPREPADPADYARACLECAGWRIVDAEEAQRNAAKTLRIPSAEIRYRRLGPGDRVKIVLTRSGRGDEALWCWVQVVKSGDDPRFVVTLDTDPVASDALELTYGDVLTVRPREVFAAELLAERTGFGFCGPASVLNS